MASSVAFLRDIIGFCCGPRAAIKLLARKINGGSIMAQVSFDCANSHGSLLDRQVGHVDDLCEARDYAKAIARSLISIPDLQDWRDCCVRVWDDLGEEIFAIPFSTVVGRPN